jgi:hypothetical protein
VETIFVEPFIFWIFAFHNTHRKSIRKRIAAIQIGIIGVTFIVGPKELSSGLLMRKPSKPSIIKTKITCIIYIF